MWPFGFGNKYPYTDFHELNADWLIGKMHRLELAVNAFIKNWSSPKPVSRYADFTDPKLIYLYVGDEASYVKNHWYYYDPDTNEWTDGGLFGSAVVDDELSLTSTNPVRNSIVTRDLRYYATPEQYGAVGDGLTNDAVAIQAALDDGKSVLLREGAVYETGDVSLHVSHNYTKILGNGATIKKTTTDGVTSAAIIADGYSYVDIDSAIFQGDLSETIQLNFDDHAIAIYNSSHSTVRNCFFNNIEGDGIYIGGLGQVNTLIIEGCRFRKSGRWAISVINGRNIDINNNIFYTNDTCCIDIEPNADSEKTIVALTNNKSYGCGQLVNLAYSHSVTDINVIVDGWTAINDSVSNTNTELYPDKVNGGLFSLRIPGNVYPEGNFIMKNIAFNGCSGRLFYERVVYAGFNVKLDDISVNGCSGSVAFTSRTDHNNTRITRMIGLAYDTTSTYTNFAELEHASGVTDGAITYNVHKSGPVPASILGNSVDSVNLYDVNGILTRKTGTITSSVGTVVVNNIVEYENFHFALVFFTPTANIAAHGTVFDFTTGARYTGWYFNGGGEQIFFYDDDTIKTDKQLTGGTSYRGYMYWMD